MFNGPINVTKGQWISILKDRSVITEEDYELLKLVYYSKDCKATSSDLAKELKKSHHVLINNQVGLLGKRIASMFSILLSEQEQDKVSKTWNIPFLGEGDEEESKTGFYWKLRPELREAIWEGELGIPEEVFERQEFYEGAIKQIFVNSYERSRDARDKCIEHYGTRCIICNFDFGKVYGGIGKDVIHVHHLKPLSEVGEKYKVDPIADLRPVCPNCHMIIHKKNPPYSIEEVKAMINDTKIE